MIRLADFSDKNKVIALRNQVQKLHFQNRPDMFKEIAAADRYDFYMQDETYSVAVYENSNDILGYIVLKKVCQDETSFAPARKYLLIEEFGVDETHRRKGVGAALAEFAKQFAKQNNFHRIQLDCWAFNTAAERFYEAMGFETYRKYMELKI